LLRCDYSVAISLLDVCIDAFVIYGEEAVVDIFVKHICSIDCKSACILCGALVVDELVLAHAENAGAAFSPST
jgi:hypothetical protein